MLRGVDVADAVSAARQLLFQCLPPLLRLFFPGRAFHGVGHLDDEVELSASGLLVHGVHDAQLADEPLDGAVGLVHDRVEGVLHDGHPLFRQDDFFLLPGPVVVKLHPHIVRVPLLHLAHPHRPDLCLPRHRVLVDVHRNDGDDAFV